MEIVIKLNNQTAGRDKLARLLQYSSKAAWYYMQTKERDRQFIDKLKSLEFTFSSFRKLLRLGRCLDSLYGVLSLLHYPDVTIRVTCALSKIANALFLLADHILWIGRTGLVSINAEKWNSVSNKYWLYSITMNLVRDMYEIYHILEQHSNRAGGLARTRLLGGPGVSAKALPIGIKAMTLVLEHKDVFVDTLKNTCDIFIPLTALGYTRLSPGTIGLLGVISSAAAIISLVDPLAKLSPA